MTQIKFGTDGWRAIRGKDFTDENVSRVIGAFCDENKNSQERRVFIGFDRRLHSDQTALLVAQILKSKNFEPVLSLSYCPTPCVSWMVKNQKALAGIVVTASHNPAQWNGIKFKENYGGAASPAYTDKIEARLPDQNPNEIIANARNIKVEEIKKFDPENEYLSHLKKLVDVDLIKKSGLKALHDPLFGAGSGFLKKIFPDQIDQIHFENDPQFGGKNPEPIEKNLSELKSHLLTKQFALGIATDGDADRIAAFDENGNYVSTHQIFALLLWHHVTRRNQNGTVIKSLSTTSLIDQICREFDLKLIETPIGFRHICHILKENDGLMGGEESGGISYRDHVHERDGLLNGLFLMEMIAANKLPLSKILQNLENLYGRFYFERRDYHLGSSDRERLQSEFNSETPSFIKKFPAFKKISRQDGIKIFYDDAWILLRSSGTEPLIRVYVEASQMQDVKKLQDLTADILAIGG